MLDEVIQMDQDDQNRNPGQDPLSDDGAPDLHVEFRGARKSGLRRLFAKRWTFPAMYLTAAALIIALMYVQANHGFGGGSGGTPVATQTGQAKGQGPTVTVSTQNWGWPVAANAKGIELLRGYYDSGVKGATVASLAKDLVQFGHSYTGSAGYDLGNPGTHLPFAVVAAAAGTVAQVQKDPVWGETVEVNDGGGYTSLYQSLGSVNVKPGETVSRGMTIGTSGTNAIEKNLGNHLFFEVEKGGVNINPASVLPNTQI